MSRHDSSSASVLYLGGTGTISAACARLSVEIGMRVTVLNRGRSEVARQLPESVTWRAADVADLASLEAALDDDHFDSVVNFLSYDAEDARGFISLFEGRTRQYVHISSASVYGKPVLQTPIVESSPTHNRFLGYARAKLRAEHALQEAYDRTGFPVTIVRPSHTYDDANPPLPGGWAAVARIADGREVPVHGDGTSLWTLTHSEDFAVGLVGLLDNPRSIGEIFHITSDDVYTWDQIYSIIGEALGVEARLVHVPSELFPVVAPDWFWSELLLGDLGHSAVFDNTKIRRYVPSFDPRLTYHRAAKRMVEWRRAHLVQTAADGATDAILERVVGAYHASRAAFADRAPR